MKPWNYLAVLLIPTLASLGLFLEGAWLWSTPVLVFVIVPLIELMTPGSKANADEDEGKARLEDWRYDAVLYSVVPIQIALVLGLLWSVSRGGLLPWELAGAVVSVGLCCGGLGINVGHELGHRRSRREQLLAKVLLGTSLYGHFFIEHNRGHHARVATPDDPASSRRGEWVYRFWFRSVCGGWMGAWRLESDRLRRRSIPVWSWHNEMLRIQTAQAVLLVTIGLTFGLGALAAFIGASTVGALLLETVNYLEHYGLRRERNARGKWERVRPAHSWNSNRPLGRILLFELTRHSDHHAHPKRPFPLLRHFEEAPELPAGYPAMVLAALVPPFFFSLMHPALARHQDQLVQAAA